MDKDMLQQRFLSLHPQYFKTQYKPRKKPNTYRVAFNEYHATHMWARKYLIQSMICENCKVEVTSKRKIHNANISGQYKRDPKDWKRLCATCHWEFDRR